MKKSLFFVAAASALMLTACSSENDVVQSAPQQQSETKALGFDVYTQNATNVTRAGRTNIMDNSTLQKTGFGVFGYQSSGTPGAYNKTSSDPNFMWNQQVNYISNAWSYSPLKYWPNETINDSQSTPAGMPDITTPANLDVLSFFAYAPWVKAAAAGTVSKIAPNEADDDKSITGLTSNATAGDPKITYAVATDPSQSVDLLWGVAPVGGLTYTAVDGNTVTIDEGMPLIDLKKPAVNTSMKFLFQHALARLGVKVVLAADQVSAGGTFDVANNKVTIESIAITGNFSTSGKLNLNNTAPNKALWENVAATPVTFTINATNGLAKHLQFDASKGPAGTPAQQLVTGVTTKLSDAIQVSNIPGYTKQSTDPAYSPSVPYFAAATDNEAPTYATYNTWAKTASTTYLQKNVLSEAYTDITGTINTTYPNATVWENIYSIADANIIAVTSGVGGNVDDCKALKAYRKNGNTYYPTGETPIVGDYVMVKDPADLAQGDATATELVTVAVPTTTTDYYFANSNYFMLIPPSGETATDKTIKVKITYYVSTTDPNVDGGVVYTKNEVEKAIELPHFKNGVAYNLKLILGMTSVKLEAEAADWVTTTSEVNLPQNISE